jgi:hypothetical protein
VAATGLALPATAAHATVTCDTNVWKVSYCTNTTFKGDPKKSACDKTIDEDHGTGDPAGVTLPKDNFGIRWTVTRDFGSGGPFAFSTAVRDGIRVHFDGHREISLWKDVTTTQKKSVKVTIPKGKHTITVKFVAYKGQATSRFQVTSTPAPAATAAAAW